MNKPILTVLSLAVALTGCASVPDRSAGAAAPVPENLTRVYFYPTQGQSEEQQDRDRYECHGWSVKQTGFDPSRYLAPGTERGSVVPSRSPGETVGAGAVLGAVVGAVAAGRGDTAEGAVLGAMAGSVLGAAAANAEEAEARRLTQARNRRGAGAYQKQAAEFRRAMSACLEGRGYSVK